MKLSIIIPCYNCEKTLKESVDSCYKQGLSNDVFEIIMVDDGSADGTRELMQKLSLEHQNIRLFFHEVNKGGGAARNTGIKEARGEIIYCLDSDNVFADNSVQPMLEYLQTHKLDGAVFHERRFFIDTDFSNYTTFRNSVLDRVIQFGDLFNDSQTLLDNFFYTKKSFLKTAGYPEHHGFDTQCFEMRYLLAGNSVRIVPESYFWHRQGMAEPSYFERVHNAGLFSINYILMFEEFFHIFSENLSEALISYPIFSTNKSYSENIIATVRKYHRNNDAFKIDVTKPLGPNISIENTQTKFDYLHDSLKALNEGSYNKSQELLTHFVNLHGKTTPYLRFLALRVLEGAAGTPHNQIPKVVLNELHELRIQRVASRYGFVTNIIKRNRTIFNLLTKLRHRLLKSS